MTRVSDWISDYSKSLSGIALSLCLQIPSDKISFDQAPEMKARAICEAGKAALRSGKYQMVSVNLRFYP